MALFRYPDMTKEEVIFVVNCDTHFLEGQAFGAQLCKFPFKDLTDISTCLSQLPDSGAPSTFKVGDMVYVRCSDGTFCRAEVLKIDGDAHLLDLVDFGDMRSFSQRELHHLDPKVSSRWDRIAIHVVLKDDMQICTDTTAVLSDIDVVHEGNRTYYHGRLGNFGSRTDASEVHSLQRYVPEVPVSPTIVESTSAAPVANGHRSDAPKAAEISQPELNEIERVFVSIDHAGCSLYGVQPARFDVAMLESELDSFFGDPKNRKAAENVKSLQYVIAPYGSQFCRAFVLSVDEGVARIIYTDYGSENNVSEKDLIELTPGRFTEHPWAAVTCSTEEKLNVEDEVTLKIESSVKDEYGLPIYTVKVCQTDALAASLPTQPAKPSYPPLSIKDADETETVYPDEPDGLYLGIQFGKYTVEELLDMNAELTNSLKQSEAPRSEADFIVEDLVAVAIDSGYYRGLVCKIEREDIWVYQVDFGAVTKAPLRGLRFLPPEFIKYPQVGCRCLLREDQLSAAKAAEVLDVKNLRKKTRTDGIDIYEFDIVEARMPNGATYEQITKPEESNSKSSEAPRTNQESVESNGGDAFKTEPKVSNGVGSEPLTSGDSATQSQRSMVDERKSEAAHVEEFEPQMMISLAEGPSAEAGTSILETRDEVSPMQSTFVDERTAEYQHPVLTPRDDNVPAEKVTYEFATSVNYPGFTSAPEKVYVSEKTDSRTFVQFCRFDLAHLDAIDSDLKMFFDANAALESTALSVGDLVAVKHDDKFHRAEVLERIGDDFLVACIDHGYAVTVPSCKSMRLPKIFEKYERVAGELDGAYPFLQQDQELDLILSVENGKVRAKTVRTASSQRSTIDYNESVHSSTPSISSESVDNDSKSTRDPENPCADKSFEVKVTSVHRASRVCVVKRRFLTASKAVGEALGNGADRLQPVRHASLSMGSVVVAKLSTDPPRFRRAKVVRYNRHTENYKLFLVDSGLIVKLPLSNLFDLPADFSLAQKQGYAKIVNLKADDLAYDSKVVSEVLAGILRCSFSYSHPDEFVPGELCYEGTLHNSSGDVVKQLNLKGIVTFRSDRFLTNPLMIPCGTEAEYLDAIVVSAQRLDPSVTDVTLLLVDLKDRLDRVVIDKDQLKNLYVMKLGAPALAYLENDPNPWQRARVTGRPFPDKYKLFLVDTGIEITHPVLKTFRCPANLLYIPETTVQVSIRSQKRSNPSDLQDKLVVVKTHWNIDYETKTPNVELYRHDGSILLP